MSSNLKFSILLLLLSTSVFSQSLKVDGVTFLALDKQGSFYVVCKERVNKYNGSLELQASYTSNFGKIHAIDVSDPFKPTLFCKDFVRLILLDNKLAALGNPIFLPDVNVLKPSLAARASDNGVWLVDAYRRQLVYLDFTLNTSRVAADLSVYELAPDYAVERNGRVYVNFPNDNIAMFDKFGALLRMIPVKASGWFEVQDEQLFFLSDKKLMRQNILDLGAPPVEIAQDVELCAVAGKQVLTYSRGVVNKSLLP